jgi:hypothetical protein
MVQASSNALWVARGNAVLNPERCVQALERDKTARRVLAKGVFPEVGHLVGVRLNLNLLRSQGVALHTLHQGGKSAVGCFRAPVIGYAEVVTLQDAYFHVDQKAREAIACLISAKLPMASIDGQMVAPDPSMDGVEVRFNPRMTHLFIDQANQAVRWAEDVTVVGHRAYCRGAICYHTRTTLPKRPGLAPSLARLRPGRAENPPAVLQAMHLAEELACH